MMLSWPGNHVPAALANKHCPVFKGGGSKEEGYLRYLGNLGEP